MSYNNANYNISYYNLAIRGFTLVAHPSIAARTYQLDVGDLIILFELDLTNLGGEVQRWVPGSIGGNNVSWRGNTYVAYPVEASGFEYNAKGPLPKPTLRASNIDGIATQICLLYGDAIGATVTRWRTLKQFLDGQASPDPDAHWPKDIFTVNRKSQANKFYVEWELTPVMDQEGRKIPGRLVIKDICTHTYRFWNGTGFVYENVTCPYTGLASFDTNDSPTSDANDNCSRRLTGCKLRFGNLPLPTRAVPGVAKVRFP